MSSAWGSSFGSAWGSAWGAIADAVTKQGGDDVPRVEIWESRKRRKKHDEDLEKSIREAYAVAVGKPIPAKKAPASILWDDEDDIEMLLMFM